MRKNDVVGFWIKRELICILCATNEERRNAGLREGTTIRRKYIEYSESATCDRCQRPLCCD